VSARARSRKIPWQALALVSILVLIALATPGFLQIEVRDGRAYGAALDVLLRAAPTALVALGMALVIATGGVDLSVGAVMAVAGTLAALVVRHGAGGAAPALAAALAGGLALGLFNGALVAGLGLQPIVATLILFVAGRGAAQLLSGGEVVSFDAPGLQSLARGTFSFLPAPVFVVLAALAAIGLVLRRTSAGLYLEAAGDHPRSARLAGVPVAAVQLGAYGASGFLAALAGVLVATDIGAADAANAGLYVELDAILAVVIGGTLLTGGRVHLARTLLGVLVLQGLTTSILILDWGYEATLMVKAAAVVAACALQSPRWAELAAARRARSEGAP
jgi:ribose/xylose/arabinose/galactoside ABC-type transport system permease subunit